jgi:hypothetical protein
MWHTATIRQPGYRQLLSEVTGTSLASDSEGIVCVQRIIPEDDETYKARRVETHLNLSDDAPRRRKS